MLLQVLLLVLLFVLFYCTPSAVEVLWLYAVSVADPVASTVTVLFWLCYCSGVDASAGPVAGAVKALNIAGTAADAIAVALLALFLVLHLLFSYCKTIQF
jgi:hypothetical protein